MRVALLTERDGSHSGGEAWAWCDRLVRGLADHDFTLYEQLGRPAVDLGGPAPAPGGCEVWTLPLYGPADRAFEPRGRAARRRFLDAYRELTGALAAARPPEAGSGPAATAVQDRFASGLHALAELAWEHGGLGAAPRGEEALRVLEAACRSRGVDPVAGRAGAADLIAVAETLERALRPLAAPWYDDDALGGADLCHATAGGTTALPGLLAARWCGTPLLVTEYGVRLREYYLTAAARRTPPAVRALTAAFHRLLAAEVYRHAAVLTPGNAHVRRWQLRCGGARDRIRIVHPGMDAAPLAAVGEAAESEAPEDGDPVLVWVGRIVPAKDLIGLLHAFGEVREAVPGARLKLVGAGPPDREYLAQCRALAAQSFPDEAADTVTAGENPVAFDEVGSPCVPTLADAYAGGAVVVLSSAVEGFPTTLVEAMFCGRATVSTDVGAVREVIGGTGLVVPPRNPRALAEACGQLLRDPARRARLGAAARARALELFTVEQNVAAFRALYLDLVAHRPAGPPGVVPFALTAESHLPGDWTAPAARRPAWARPPADPAADPAPDPAADPAPDPGARPGAVPARDPARDREAAPATEPVPAGAEPR
jgi:glycosyltransferase involved in cell wall biosynthesis